MLALVVIFLVTLIVSATAIWVYRKLSVWHGHGFTETLVSGPGSTAKMKIGARQGTISLVSKRRNKSRNTKLRSSKGENNTPWGW